MDSHRRLRDYATIAVRTGANVAEGQNVFINCYVAHAEFARALARAAYDAGARYVDIWYFDEQAKRARLEHAPEDTLEWVPPWLDRRNDQMIEDKGAVITITGDPAPELFGDLEPARAGKDLMPRLPSRLRVVASEQANWCIVAYPNEAWAELVYGEPDLERLWGAVTRFMRLDQPDPVAAWQEHMDNLLERARQMNDRRFDAVRFSGPGTDLLVGLLPGSAWQAAGFSTKWGRHHIPNMPTEEIFTTPDFRRTEGTVRATRPLALGGTIVRDLEIEFRSGRAVRVDASSGRDVVLGQHSKDAGASMIGEVALVDGSSLIGQSKTVFFETLFDENATSHIAYGGGYPHCVEGASGAAPDELTKLGVNYSIVHTDFMIGGSEVDVFGVEAGAGEIPLIVDDAWQLA